MEIKINKTITAEWENRWNGLPAWEYSSRLLIPGLGTAYLYWDGDFPKYGPLWKIENVHGVKILDGELNSGEGFERFLTPELAKMVVEQIVTELNNKGAFA